jgi:hypothetical protein
MRRLLAAAALIAATVVALPLSADAAKKSCKPKKEAKGCTIKNAEWGVANSFERSANIRVSRDGIDEIITMLPGSPSGDYPSAPKQCAVAMSTSQAVFFAGAPRIKGPIKMGKTYSKSSTYHADRSQPNFRDPGGAFGGNAIVQTVDASYELTVKFISAKKVRVTASGTNKVTVTYRDPNSGDSDPKYLPGTFTCKGTYSGTLPRGRY